MAAVSKAACEQGGLTLGILPGESKAEAAPGITIPIPTGMGSARNNINVLASDLVVVIAFNLGPGTLSEYALAKKAGRPILVIGPTNHPLFTEEKVLADASQALPHMLDLLQKPQDKV